jgi:hypothetical protein
MEQAYSNAFIIPSSLCWKRQNREEGQNAMSYLEPLRWASVAFGTLSALFWLWAAAVRSPREMMLVYGGPGPVHDLAHAVRKQSRLNGSAAAFAALAALSHAIALALAG